MTESVIAQNPIEAQEVWKDIPGYPGYEVSEFGNVRSYWKENGRKPATITNTFKMLKHTYHYRGRAYAHITKDKVCHNFAVHRIVLLAFIGPCPDGMVGCHNDGNHLNNHISNLRWDTPKSNWNDRRLHGVACIGEKSGSAKLTNDEVIAIRVMSSKGISYKCLADIFGIHKKNIALITRNLQWQHIGGPIDTDPVKKRKTKSRPNDLKY